MSATDLWMIDVGSVISVFTNKYTEDLYERQVEECYELVKQVSEYGVVNVLKKFKVLLHMDPPFSVH